MSVATGLTSVTTDIDFDGFGILAGLDGERRSKCCGGLLYGKVIGSLLAGDWRADYRQTNQFGGGVIANHFEDFRVTPTLDAELGFGWTSKGGRVAAAARPRRVLARHGAGLAAGRAMGPRGGARARAVPCHLQLRRRLPAASGRG
ncbi:MAG: Lpg1974 family pore-forming outer membrane protein, partial [Pirellulaceae bacterium]